MTYSLNCLWETHKITKYLEISHSKVKYQKKTFCKNKFSLQSIPRVVVLITHSLKHYLEAKKVTKLPEIHHSLVKCQNKTIL